MSADRDFCRVIFKVNAAGSWATLVSCDTEHYDAVKAACATIAGASAGRIRFKALDAAGGELESYSPDRNGRLGWHEPGRLAS